MINPVKWMLLVTVSMALASAHLALANDDDDEKTLRQAMEDAQKAAAKAGIKVPDATKQLEQMEKDNADEAAAEPKKKTAAHSPAVTLPLKALPDWIPAIPNFQPKPNAVKKQEDGVETGEMKGTSSTSPEAIAEAWHTAATDKKMSFGRQDSNINGKKSVRITLSDYNGGGGEAALELEPGKSTAIEVSYKVSISASPAATP